MSYETAKPDFYAIPIIDVSPLEQDDVRALREVADEIRSACTQVGFFYIRNHGVPETVIDNAAKTAKQFFSLPLDEKQRVAINQLNRGFMKIGIAKMAGFPNPDQNELFTIGLELDDEDADVKAGAPLRGPNNWPSFMPQMQEHFYRYYLEVVECSRRLLQAVAVGLDLSDDFFASKYTKPLVRSQLVYYPPHPPELGNDHFGVAPHTDFGCITLLWQDNNGGLQVQNLAGDWVNATPIEDTFVVNVGDLLGRWSNDRFRSTRHRVINSSGRERYSIATFCDPDFDAWVDPKQMGLEEGDQSRYEPVRAGEHILRRFDESFSHRKGRVR